MAIVKVKPSLPSRSWQTEFVEGDHPNRKPSTKPNTIERAAFVRINIFQIGDVDTVACTFATTFFLTATWVEPTLDYATLEALKPEEQSSTIRAAFDPRIQFMNATGLPEIEEGPTFKLVKWRRGHDNAPAVTLTMRVTGTFREQFELGWFPFDTQPLNLIVTSKHRANVFSLYGEQEASRVRTEYMVLPEFLMSPVQFCVARTGGHTDLVSLSYPLLYMGVVAKRRHGYYSWNVFLPTLLLTAMAISTFAVPATDVADRLSVILTLVLTAVAFKFVVSQSLPNIPYNTFLDWYVLISFLLLMLIVIDVSVVGFLIPHAPDAADTIDRAVLYTSAGVLVVWHVLTFGALAKAMCNNRQQSIGPSAAVVRSGRVTVFK